MPGQPPTVFLWKVLDLVRPVVVVVDVADFLLLVDYRDKTPTLSRRTS